MISAAPILTDAGKSLLIRGIGGEQITFTRFKAGNGELGTLNPQTLADLINVVIDFPIDNANASDDGFLQLSGSFLSSDIPSDFYWTELGVYAYGEDNTEVLYAYVCDDVNASHLKANMSDVVVEQNVNVVVAIGTAENVTAIINQSAVYVTKEDFDAHANNKANPHNVTKEQLGLGNVQNVSTNDSTPTYQIPENALELVSGEKLSVAFGKIARALKNLIAHIANQTNPHKVTAEQTGAAKSTHSHAATDINSGTLSVVRGGTGGTTAQEARANLNAAAKSQAVTLTVAASAWTGEGPYTATVSCSIATAGNNLVVGAGGTLTEEQQEAMVAAMIVCTAQAASSITLTAFGDVPEIDLPINVLEVG